MLGGELPRLPGSAPPKHAPRSITPCDLGADGNILYQTYRQASQRKRGVDVKRHCWRRIALGQTRGQTGRFPLSSELINKSYTLLTFLSCSPQNPPADALLAYTDNIVDPSRKVYAVRLIIAFLNGECVP